MDLVVLDGKVANGVHAIDDGHGAGAWYAVMFLVII